MKILLKSLTLINFKGVKSLTIEPNDVETFIYGRNEAGKTTIFDSFIWLLFGKDSTDRKDFNAQTLDKDGNRIDYIETEVSAVLVCNNITYEFKHVLRQKWVKKRGAEKEDYTGNEHLYFINDVPHKLSDYQFKINALIEEDIFKLITNVTYFNSLPWQKRRQILSDMANVSDETVAATNPDYQNLLQKLATERKTKEEYKREISARKKKLSDELKTIPPRIDEVRMGMPEQKQWQEIEKEIASLQEEITVIDDSISDVVKTQEAANKQILDHNKKVNDARLVLQKVEHELYAEYTQYDAQNNARLQNMKMSVNDADYQVNRLASEIESIRQSVIQGKNEQNALREKWASVNAEAFAFDENTCICPTCKQVLPEETISAQKETLLKNFNEDKTKRLLQITEKGKSIGKRLLDDEARVAELNERYQEKKAEADQLKLELNMFVSAPVDERPAFESIRDSNERYTGFKKILDVLVAGTPKPDAMDNEAIREFRQKKNDLQTSIDEYRRLLNDKVIIENANVRILQLEGQERDYAQQLAELERTEFVIDNFTKDKMNMIEQAVNDKFSVVKFKMFNTLINGGEEPCCEATVNGVPYADVNTAGKIQAGLDIIKALSQHYGVSAPIIIDNRESVTEIPYTDSQVINLIVSPADKVLRVA